MAEQNPESDLPYLIDEDCPDDTDRASSEYLVDGDRTLESPTSPDSPASLGSQVKSSDISTESPAFDTAGAASNRWDDQRRETASEDVRWSVPPLALRIGASVLAIGVLVAVFTWPSSAPEPPEARKPGDGTGGVEREPNLPKTPDSSGPAAVGLPAAGGGSSPVGPAPTPQPPVSQQGAGEIRGKAGVPLAGDGRLAKGGGAATPTPGPRPVPPAGPTVQLKLEPPKRPTSEIEEDP